MAYRDSTTLSGTADPISVAVPAGVQADDIVILVATTSLTGAVFDPADWPTGFTELAEADVNWHGLSAAIGWKRLTGADSGSYTFGTVSTSADWICQAFAFSGRHLTDPPTSTTATQSTGQSSPVSVNASTITALDGDDLLWVSAPDVLSSGVGTGHSAPTNYTEAEDDEFGFSDLSGAYSENVSAGATGTVTGTFTLSSGEAGWAAFLVRIPAGDVGPEPEPGAIIFNRNVG